MAKRTKQVWVTEGGRQVLRTREETAREAAIRIRQDVAERKVRIRELMSRIPMQRDSSTIRAGDKGVSPPVGSIHSINGVSPPADATFNFSESPGEVTDTRVRQQHSVWSTHQNYHVIDGVRILINTPDVDAAIEAIDELTDTILENKWAVPANVKQFFSSVFDSSITMAEGIYSRQRVTGKQIRAIANWTLGIGKWCGRS